MAKRKQKEPTPKRIIATREEYEAEAEQVKARMHPSLRDGFIYMPSDVILPEDVEKEIMDTVFPLERRQWFFQELLRIQGVRATAYDPDTGMVTLERIEKMDNELQRKLWGNDENE